jgi:hypothetical protein
MITTHKTMQKASGAPSEYEWHQHIEQLYENLTAAEVESLVRQVGAIIKAGTDSPYLDTTKSIAAKVWQTREISFKQWKCLRAFISAHTKVSKKKF